MVEKPDVYICLKCKHRFQKPIMKSLQIEEGIYAQQPVCPKCNSDKIVTSAVAMKNPP